VSVPFLIVALMAFLAFSGVIICAILWRGDFRAGFKSPIGQFFLEAKERGNGDNGKPPTSLLP
jgi:hypothetical protein